MSRVQNFLKLYRSKSTVKTYRWALTEFFKTVYGENEGKLEQHAERYFTEKRDVKEDIQNFFVAVKERPPKSVRLMLAAVRSFLIENEVELSAKFWRRLVGRVKGNRALTLDKVPSNRELRRILMHMSIQGKTLYLSLESSGMRIGEALQVQLRDIELDAQPCKINLRGEYTKSGNPRIAFVSSEAKMAIQEWLKVRPHYLKAASGKSHRYGKSVDDPRLFPFQDNTAYTIWKNALSKSGFLKKDKATNRHTIHPHVLRKFFRTKLGSVIPVDVVEALMGHEAYLTDVYRRYSAEDLAKFYSQGESALLIFTEAEEVSKLRIEVEQGKKQLQDIVNTLVAENTDQRRRMRIVEKKIDELEGGLQETKKLLKEMLEQKKSG